MACLDTSVLLDLNGRGGERRWRAASICTGQLLEAGESLSTTRLCVAELWVGIARARQPGKERDAVNLILSPLRVLDFDQRSAEAYGVLSAQLARTGRLCGDMDLLIAAIALVNGESLVTADVKHFSRIPGLNLIKY